jgi:hypothetical protein
MQEGRTGRRLSAMNNFCLRAEKKHLLPARAAFCALFKHAVVKLTEEKRILPP